MLYRYCMISPEDMTSCLENSSLDVVADAIRQSMAKYGVTAFVYLRPLVVADTKDGFGALDEKAQSKLIELLVQTAGKA